MTGGPLLPATERANRASAGIDAKDSLEILQVIHGEDRLAWAACGEVLERLSKVVDEVVRSFRAKGRLFYFGAGTSGRLGVLDASECPPTFGVAPDLVQGIIAGGETALRNAVEEAEDSPAAGARAAAEAEVSKGDVVCGIAASGTTPFVWGALDEARKRGATTVLIHCNPDLREGGTGRRVDHQILLPVGPEVVAGSTRMKSGTATKMVLNMLTTASMIRWGKVYDNLMVDVRPTNKKLVRRAVRLICKLADVDEERAVELFETSGRNVKVAVVMARNAVSPDVAKEILDKNEGSLREAMQRPRES